MKPTVRYIFLMRAAVMVAATYTLAGCDTVNGWFASDRVNYKKSAAGPALSIPNDLSREGPSGHFTMPDNKTLLGNPSSQTSAAQNKAMQQQRQGLHIEFDGKAYWLITAHDSPEQLWPKLQALWQKNGFTLTTDQPELGIMETSWAENRAQIPADWFRKTVGKVFESVYSSGTRDKFRTLIERRTNGTAISITHYGMEEVLVGRKDATRWQDRAREPNLEIAFLKRFMQDLGASEQQAQQLITQAQRAERATVVVNERASATLIALDESFERAWWRVGLALDRMGFVIDQRNKEQGLYQGYLSVEVKQKTNQLNAFRKLFSRSSEKTSTRYLIRVQSVAANKTQIAVVTESGQIDNRVDGRNFILALHAQLN